MDRKALRGLGLLIGAMYGLDLFSAFMSSPWSTEAFGADSTRAASARRLVMISAAAAFAAGGLATYLDKTPWPLVGSGGAAVFMFILYEQALERGAKEGYQGVNLASGSS